MRPLSNAYFAGVFIGILAVVLSMISIPFGGLLAIVGGAVLGVSVAFALVVVFGADDRAQPFIKGFAHGAIAIPAIALLVFLFTGGWPLLW